MILSVIQTRPLLALNLAVLLVAALGTVANSWMLSITIRRTLLVKRSGEDGIAHLEMRRATRCEVSYFCFQVGLLVVALRQFNRVVPILPDPAVNFFFESMAVRAGISIGLAYLSAFDLIDRRRIAVELDKLHPETPPSEVG